MFFRVLIPPDAEVTGVEVVASEQQGLTGSYRVLPAQKPIALKPVLAAAIRRAGCRDLFFAGFVPDPDCDSDPVRQYGWVSSG